jgi:hypothetical protein
MTRMRKDIHALRRERDFFSLAAGPFALARRASACGKSSCRQKGSIHEFTMHHILHQLDGWKTGCHAQSLFRLAASSR